MLQTLRPDPTFHPSPRLAMEAEVEHIAYTVLLSPDRSRPDPGHLTMLLGGLLGALLLRRRSM